MFVRQPSYHVRYDIFGLAKGVYEQQFPFQLERELEKAVQNAIIRGRA